MHPYGKHSENAVGHRRANKFTTGSEYKHGGSIVKEAKNLAKNVEKEEAAEEKHGGGKVGGRLDKRARGGAVAKRALGGSLAPSGKPRKFTPSKHKPHVNVNVVHVQRGPRPPMGMGGLGGGPALAGPAPIGAPPPGGVPMPPMKRGGAVKKRAWGGPLGGVAPMGRPAFAGAPVGVAPRPVGLPAQAAPAALAALAARPALPAAAQGVRPFKRGGKVRRASGGAIAKMRKGKDYGQGSGEGRLEEFKHMKGR